jgi:tetratricopeptide (TPR) repeat protein
MNLAMRLALIVAAGIAAASSAAAQETWVGKTIIIKKPGVKIGHTGEDGRQVYVGELYLLHYKVRGEKEGWLQVNGGRGNTGWFDKADAVVLEDAVGYFTERIRQNANDSGAYLRRAVAWRLKGEPDIAIKDLGEALRLSPAAAIYDSRGLAWTAKKEYGKAIADYGEAIRLDPKDPAAYNNRGIVWAVAKKDYEKALADFEEAIRLDAKLEAAHYNKVCAYALQGKKDLALDHLRHTLDLGYRNFDGMAKDTDLDSIRNEPRYKELLKKYMK